MPDGVEGERPGPQAFDANLAGHVSWLAIRASCSAMRLLAGAKREFVRTPGSSSSERSMSVAANNSGAADIERIARELK